MNIKKKIESVSQDKQFYMITKFQVTNVLEGINTTFQVNIAIQIFFLI